MDFMRDATSTPSSTLPADSSLLSQNQLSPSRRIPVLGGNAFSKTRGWMSCPALIVLDASSEHDGLILCFPVSPQPEPPPWILHENRLFIADFSRTALFDRRRHSCVRRILFVRSDLLKPSFSITIPAFKLRRRPPSFEKVLKIESLVSDLETSPILIWT
jgi:hypothetical protein